MIRLIGTIEVKDCIVIDYKIITENDSICVATRRRYDGAAYLFDSHRSWAYGKVLSEVARTQCQHVPIDK